MALMQCDVCGKALTMDVSGEFAVCEFCGVKHPKERLIEKVKGANNNATVEEVPVVEESVVEEAPAIEEPVVEEPVVAEEPVVEEPVVAEEPVAEEEEDDFLLDDEPLVFEEPIIIGNPIIASNPVASTPLNNETAKEASEEETTVEEAATEVEETADTASSEAESADDTYQTVIVSSSNGQDMLDEKLEEKKKALLDELKEFQEMYDNNKNSFFGEGLKRKNYANMKINDINDRLRELTK